MSHPLTSHTHPERRHAAKIYKRPRRGRTQKLNTPPSSAATTDSIVVGAEADAGARNLARGVVAALGVGRLLVGDGAADDGGRRRADERAVLLVRAGLLERALRLCGDAVGNVGGARLEDAAGGGAEVAAHALDLDLLDNDKKKRGGEKEPVVGEVLTRTTIILIVVYLQVGHFTAHALGLDLLDNDKEGACVRKERVCLC